MYVEENAMQSNETQRVIKAERHGRFKVHLQPEYLEYYWVFIPPFVRLPLCLAPHATFSC